MAQVEERISQVIKAAPPDMSEQIAYVLDGGKLVRPALTLLAGKFYQGNQDSVITVAAAMELLHTATLIHDDIIDNSDFRRGKQTISSVHSNHYGVLLGDYLFAASAHMTASTENIRAMKLHAHALMPICKGEIEESLNLFNPSKEHYFQRIADKTASLFSASTEFGGILSNAPEEAVQALSDYGHYLGMNFQIVDDILDCIGQTEKMGKPVASDLSQGVLTLPTILLLDSPEGKSIKETLETDKEKAMKLIMEKGFAPEILEECYHVAEDFSSKARLALDKLPQNSITELLATITSDLLKRAK